MSFSFIFLLFPMSVFAGENIEMECFHPSDESKSFSIVLDSDGGKQKLFGQELNVTFTKDKALITPDVSGVPPLTIDFVTGDYSVDGIKKADCKFSNLEALEKKNTVGAASYAEEIVINTKGESVLLKSDGTWEILSSSGEDGKVVFRIIDGVDSYESYARKDDFEKITHYDNYVGCLYTIEAENRTKHTVKVDYFKLRQNDKDMFPRGHMAYAFYQFNKVIEPGKKASSTGSTYYDEPLRAKTDLKTKGEPTNAEIETLIKRYGCKAQTGKIYLAKSGSDEAIVIFSPDSGVTDSAIRSFVKTSQSGMFPLQEKIRW